MAISPARLAAYRILLRVEREAAYADELLNSEICAALSPADRGLAMNIVMGALRWQSRLDSAIGEFAGGRLDSEVRVALRMGAYQLGFLDRVPARAAIFESVELVKSAKKRSAGPLVNAVLRKISERPEMLREPGTARADTDAVAMAQAFAHPEWMVQRWLESLGAERTQRICSFNQQAPPVTLRIAENQDLNAVESELRSGGIELAPAGMLARSRVVTSGDLVRARGFLEGRVAIQDEGSQLVALLVGGTIRGRDAVPARILDCCAAPGSKTRMMAERNPEARITAVELHPHRARLLKKLVTAANVTVMEGDITADVLPPDARFERVLADVPCTGTGTLARNPEIKWRLNAEDIAELAALQREILRAAMRHVAPGGRLVYSTCSLEREENAQVVEAALNENHDFTLAPMRGELERLRGSGELIWPQLDSLCEEDYLRTVPGVHPCDGFFAAVMERKK